MKNCTDCKYADWDTAKNGRLHPSGDGQCKYPLRIPDLPQSMYWVGSAPKPCGGHINRRSDLKDHCAYFVHEAT